MEAGLQEVAAQDEASAVRKAALIQLVHTACKSRSAPGAVSSVRHAPHTQTSNGIST